MRNAGASGLVELRSRLEEEEEEQPGPAPGGSFSALQPSMLPGDLALEREREDPHGQQDYRCFFISNLFSMIYHPSDRNLGRSKVEIQTRVGRSKVFLSLVSFNFYKTNDSIYSFLYTHFPVFEDFSRPLPSKCFLPQPKLVNFCDGSGNCSLQAFTFSDR